MTKNTVTPSPLNGSHNDVVAGVSTTDLPDPEPPSQPLKVMLDYLDNVKRWDFDVPSKQFTSDFTLQILPASLRLSPRTKSEYMKGFIVCGTH